MFRCLDEMNNAEHIQVESVLPVYIRQIPESTKSPCSANVVNQDVQPSKNINNPHHRGTYCFLIDCVNRNDHDV